MAYGPNLAHHKFSYTKVYWNTVTFICRLSLAAFMLQPQS